MEMGGGDRGLILKNYSGGTEENLSVSDIYPSLLPHKMSLYCQVALDSLSNYMNQLI